MLRFTLSRFVEELQAQFGFTCKRRGDQRRAKQTRREPTSVLIVLISYL